MKNIEDGHKYLKLINYDCSTWNKYLRKMLLGDWVKIIQQI